LLLNKFFSDFDICLSCEDIAQQSCATVPRWRFLAIFFSSCTFASFGIFQLQQQRPGFLLLKLKDSRTRTELKYFIKIERYWNKKDVSRGSLQAAFKCWPTSCKRLQSAGNPSNTMWPALMSASVPSGVFIHPAFWPQWCRMPLATTTT